jgi:polyhydroxyalkanoic acid synthase PhaR subunit
VWQQWYDAATGAWAKAMRGDNSTPFTLYRQWMQGFETARAQSSEGAAQATPSPGDLWKQWFEASASGWESLAEMGTDALGLTTQWTEMLEEARAKLLAGESLPQDPLSFFIQWYNATSEVWSRAVGDVIGTEAFVAAASRFLESYMGYAKTFRHVSQEYFSNLQLATRPDIARVASLVVALEDKVDHLEVEFEGFSDNDAKLIRGAVAQGDALQGIQRRLDQLEQHLQQVESTMSRLQSTLQQILTAVEKAPEAGVAETKEAPTGEHKAGTKRASASGQPVDQA